MALNVVYPKTKNVIINSPSTFFVGSANPNKPLMINNENVPVHKSGGFAFPVKLSTGNNIFKLVSDKDTLIFKIIRPKPTAKNPTANKYIEYKEIKTGFVKSNLSPLRSEAIDGGINRLAHLQTYIPLTLLGEKNGFYKVKLSDNNFAWILKPQVNIENQPINPVEIFGYEYRSDKLYDYFIFHLSSRTIWTLESSKNKLNLGLHNIKDLNNNFLKFEITSKELFDKDYWEGFDGYYENNDFVLKVRKPVKISNPKNLKNTTIVIDPGHGGNEFGAIGCLGDKEKDINLKYAKLLENKLKESGANVILTRTDDEFVSLQDRVKFTNSKDGVIFISLHSNALPDNQNPLTKSGVEVYYYYDQAKPLAESIMISMVNSATMKNNGIYQRSYAVVRNSAAVSILIEIGYLINPEDNANIIDENFRKKAVDAISDGIKNYLHLFD